MNINLHIDRIVLDGVDMTPGQCHLLKRAVVNELMNILSKQPIAASDCKPGASVPATIPFRSTRDVASLAPQLAGAVYGSVLSVPSHARNLQGAK